MTTNFTVYGHYPGRWCFLGSCLDVFTVKNGDSDLNMATGLYAYIATVLRAVVTICLRLGIRLEGVEQRQWWYHR
jgi:hypothetical protein